ncbi:MULTISPECIES: tyrosine-type recombinase/integrase [Flavobacterium]|uniref:Tyrosine-type recombinase/integrase n=1 Tax=Flavobacterium jumunjinense TaxID=998845 RepID=A0ABV5GP63_9FLAO|nr:MULTISPECIES: tyrosine-type recombinase/integrase [Flavobacterium]
MNLHDYLHQNLQPSTVKNYNYEIQKFRSINKNTEKYNYQKIMEYVAHLRKNYNPKSTNRAVAALKKYYQFLIETGKRKDNPTLSIKLRDSKEDPIQLQDLFTEKELELLLQPRKERYPILEKRNKIILSLLVNQALKPGEIQQLKTNDIDLEKAQIHIAKTGLTNSRILPLKAEQIFLLHQYLTKDRNELKTLRNDKNALLLGKLGTPITTDDIHYLVTTYQNQFNKKLTSITIRQSVITNLLAKNNNLRIVQEFAGHKHLDTTEKYKQSGIKALQNAIQIHHPMK